MLKARAPAEGRALRERVHLSQGAVSRTSQERSVKRYAWVLAMVLSAPALPLHAAEPDSAASGVGATRSDAPVFVHRGDIDVLDLENNQLVVAGMGFEAPLEVTVSIRGTASAFSLLQEGMKAEVAYYEYPDRRVAINISQLPDNLEIEQF
jgi:hypothetical protein